MWASGVGSASPRPDALAKLTGRFPYASQAHAPGELHGATVRSPVASAELIGVETAEALALPGAVRVLTVADVPGTPRVGVKTPDQPVLADGVVRHHGEPIAFVVAETPETARRMAALVRPVLRPRPALLDPALALEPGVPLVHPGGNLVHRLFLRHGPGRRGPVAVRRRWRTGRQDAAFLAPEAGLALPDGEGGVVLHVATQDLHHDRDQIAAALGLPPERVLVTLAGVGGAFGGREDITLHVHLCLAALLTGRPVRAVYPRPESFGAHPSRHPAIMAYELTAERDGTFVSLTADLLFDGGAYASTSRAVVGIAHYFAAGPYRVPDVEVTSRAVYTNNPVAGALRGFGATQVCFAMESTVDALAGELGLDPVEVRRRNLLAPGERLATSGQRLVGTVAPVELLDAVTRVPPPGTPPAPGHRRGTGVALGIKSAGLGDGRPDGAGVVLRIGRDGLEIASAAPEVGQGIGSVLAQIARERLGPVAVRFAAPTSDLPVSGGSKASRQTMASGGAMDRAARALRARLDELAVRQGLPGWDDALAADPGRLLGSAELTVREWYDTPATQGADPGTGQGDLHIAFQLTAHRAVVDVDPELGTARVVQIVAAQDVGRAVNPDLVRGQLVGGAVQGAGFALLEEIPVDDEGRGGATGFDVYLLPTALDVPEVIPVILESADPDPRLPHGAKGIGEGPLISSPAALAAALRQASGRPVPQIPAHPHDLTLRDPTPDRANDPAAVADLAAGGGASGEVPAHDPDAAVDPALHGTVPGGVIDPVVVVGLVGGGGALAEVVEHDPGGAVDLDVRGVGRGRAVGGTGARGGFVRPRSVAMAVEVRADLPHALVSAGGTAVQPAMNAGRSRPGAVLDLSGMRDGRSIDRAGGRLRLGPVVTVAEAAGYSALGPGILTPMLAGFATPAVRERATPIGNLFQPPRDLAVVLCVMDATLALLRSGGPGRAITVPGLVAGAETLEPAELAVGLEVSVPLAFAYERLARRAVSAPTLAVVAVAVLDDGPRVAVGGSLFSSRPTRLCPEAASYLRDPAAGDEFSAALVRELASVTLVTAYAASVVRSLALRCHRRVHGRLPA